MDGLNPASPPKSEPASGKMSLRDAVRAGVNSLPQFSGSQASSEATDDLASTEAGPVDALAGAPSDTGTTAPEAPDAGQQDTSVERPVEGQPDEQASQDSLAALARWPEDRRQAFEALPDEAKRIILEREKELNKGLTQHAQQSAESRKKLEAINSLFQDHHRKEMEAVGYDEARTIQELLTRHDSFNRDPVGYGAAVAQQLGNGDPSLYIAELIKRTGVTQDQLFGGRQPQEQPQGQPSEDDWEDDWEDPAIVEMNKRLDAVDQYFKQQQQRQQQQAVEYFQNQVSAFENAVNEDGAPKYPHLSSVTQDIIMFVQNNPELYRNPQAVLEDAYHKAIRFNPEVSKQLMEEEISKRLAAQEQKQAAERAKRASPAQPSPGSSGGTVTRGKMSLRDAVRAPNVKSVLTQ